MNTAQERLDPRRKIVDLATAVEQVEQAKREGKTVVMTNGCFDLVHSGHAFYLSMARADGDLLVVGLNSDESVRQLKGPPRPIMDEKDRAYVLAALECVDLVVIFRERTAEELIKALKPQVYHKGGDYTLETINQDERHLVESYGGKITIFHPFPSESTTDIFERIRALCTQGLDEPPSS